MRSAGLGWALNPMMKVLKIEREELDIGEKVM